MITVNIVYNAFSDRFDAYTVKGKSRPARNLAVYNLAKATYEALSDKFNSAKLKEDKDDEFSVWDIRENKPAQAACWVLQKGMKALANEYPAEVECNIINKFEA